MTGIQAEPKTHRIVRLDVENLQRLQAVSISPDGNVVEFTGKNGAGKSSILNAIVWALGGTADIPPAPIRRGQKSALIKVDLGGLKVTRKLTAKEGGGYTPSLIVENADGNRYQSPQAILDALIGKIAFDPLEFTRMKPRDQLDTLRRLVVGFDFDENARLRKKAFDDRTDFNRDVKTLRSQAAGITFPGDTPLEEIDVSALSAELQRVGEHNAGIEQRKARREAVAADAERLRREADSHNEQAEGYRRLAEEADAKATSLRDQATDNERRLAEAGPLPDPLDAGDIRQKIDNANRVNVAVRDKLRRDVLEHSADEKSSKADGLTNEIGRLDSVKATAISGAAIPVDGIGFSDDGITLGDLPFQQASSAEQLRASIGIAISANPRLRVLIVRDGALLDNDSMEIVAEMAEKNDIQVWIESVASGRPSAIVIEDGTVAVAAPAKAA